jgi:hypothetical protein
MPQCLNWQRGRLSRHLSGPRLSILWKVAGKNATLAKAAFFSQGADVRCRASVAYADVNDTTSVNAAMANKTCAAPFIFEFSRRGEKKMGFRRLK